MPTKEGIKSLFDENLRRKFGKRKFSAIVDALYNSPTAKKNLDILKDKLTEYNKNVSGKVKFPITLSPPDKMPYGGYTNGVPHVYINPSNPLLSKLGAKEFAVIIARESGIFNWKMPDDIQDRLERISITGYIQIRSQIEGRQTVSQVRAERELGVVLSIGSDKINKLKREFLNGEYINEHGVIDYETFGFRYIAVSNLYNEIINDRIVKILEDLSISSDLLPNKYRFFDKEYAKAVDIHKSLAIRDDLLNNTSDIEEDRDYPSDIEGDMSYTSILKDKGGNNLAAINLMDNFGMKEDNPSGEVEYLPMKGQRFISIEFLKDPGHHIVASTDMMTGQFEEIQYFDAKKHLKTTYYYVSDTSKSPSTTTYPNITHIERKDLSRYFRGYIDYTVVNFSENKIISEKKFTRPSPFNNLYKFDWHPDLSDAEHAPLVDPIVLDLDGDGVKTLSLARRRHFDLDNNGFAEQTAWVDSGDGLLVLDLDGNGRIERGAELFGNHTALGDGTNAADGYAALAQYDDNGDGRIDAGDAIWQQLQVWRDDKNDASRQTIYGEVRC